jgi:hypothetical protein
VNVAFEIAQHPLVRGAVVDGIQQLGGAAWPTRLLANYLYRGTFDIADLLAATFGSLAAAALLTAVRHARQSHAH